MRPSTTQVSVVISTKDRPAALRRCLQSLRGGSAIPAEVVISDQSDGDDTRAVADDARADELEVRYLRARLGGLGAAQNDGVGAAGSEVVAVLDDDCVADERWLETIAREFAADDALVLLAGRVLPLGPPTQGTYAVSSRLSTVPRVFTDRAKPWDVGSGNNFAVRRAWFDRIGGCDERLGPGAPLLGGLDMDLFYRLLRAGGQARYEPSVLVLHERTTLEGRRSRRFAYGYGMAAATGIWLRQGDTFALRVLAAWLGMRTSLLGRALAKGRWTPVREEALVLRGTTQGFVRGLLAADNTET
jgi:GT2 family glycosyltransferase